MRAEHTTVSPQDVARSLDELAMRLEILARQPSRARAYRSLAKRMTKGQVASASELPPWLARDLDELVRWGTCEALDDARVALPAHVVDLAAAKGVGPTLARSLWRKSHAATAGELADTIRSGFLPRLPAFGPRARARVTALLPEAPSGTLLAIALDAGRTVEAILRDRGARRVAVVGETRRGEEIVSELTLLCAGLDERTIAQALFAADSTLLVRDVRTQARSVTCILQGRGPLRIHTCAAQEWWLELLVRTGDDDHVRWLEQHARLAGYANLGAAVRNARNEDDAYARIGLAPVPPELRRGATGRAPARFLPDRAVRGAFHVHTDWSDGASSLDAMAEAATRAGYEYLGISDHSRAAPYANGLDQARLARQARAIREARAKFPSLAILHGIEVDIMADGSLDLPDLALAKLDFVIASVHSDTRMDARAMTARLVRALSNPLVTMLGHPTGRLLSGKAGYAYDLDAVARAAAANDTWIEINANGHRLDLSPALARRAHAHGVRFAINPDAHSIEGLCDVGLGERIARRAGLASDDIVNTRDRRAMLRLLATRKKRALAALRAPSA